MAWRPTEIKRYVEPRQSSTQVVIVETDVGLGFLKAMGNPEGDHALACDLVGNQLAEWFGLRTLEQALVTVDDIVPIKFLNGKFAALGPALVTRAEFGEPWSGNVRQLRRLTNPEDISKLVVFDTWIINRDRHSLNRQRHDNVFLSGPFNSIHVELFAIDHTHCFGVTGRINRHAADIANWRDSAVYGLFPEFRDFLKRSVVRNCVKRLRLISKANVERFINKIPREWDVPSDARDALLELIVARATFVADNIERYLWPQKEFPFMDEA